MAEDTVVAPATPETEPSGDSKTTVQPNAPIQGNAIDPAEVERLRKEAMRVRQLENELEARRKADEEAKAKKLEEDQKYKELWEKERAEREALVQEREAAELKAKLQTATDNLFKDYPTSVREIAQETGLGLTDDSEEAQAALKTKLDSIASKVGSQKVEANNPAPTPAPTTDREREIEVLRMNNVPKVARQAALKKSVGSLKAIEEMRAMNGITPVQQ